MGIVEYLKSEGAVIARAPLTFVLGAAVITGAMWVAAGFFYREEISAAKQETAAAKQETATVGQQRDLFKGRLDLLVTAPPQSPSAPAVGPVTPEKKTSVVIVPHKGADTPVVVSSKPLPADPTGNNVTSYYQTGGITAGTLNVGPQPRVLRDEDKRLLLDKLPRDKPIEITALLGDGEAISLATDIYAFLKANGFKMADTGISQGVFTGPVNGVQIATGGPKISIVVGANLPARPSPAP